MSAALIPTAAPLTFSLFSSRTSRAAVPAVRFSGLGNEGRAYAYINKLGRDLLDANQPFDIYTDEASRVIGLKFHPSGRYWVNQCGRSQYTLARALHSLEATPGESYEVRKAPAECPCQFLIYINSKEQR